MIIIQTEDFDRAFKKLPADARHLYLIQYHRFQVNVRDPRLHVKKLQDEEGVFSLRVTRRYRVLFYFQNSDTAIFFDIDHRKDVYRDF